MTDAFEVYQHQIWNPGASEPLRIPVLVVANTPDEQLKANVRHNGALDLPWLAQQPENSSVAVIVGGGPSVADCVDDLQHHAAQGHSIFGINAAATWLLDECGILPTHQVTCDAKQETSTLIDPRVWTHILASQCHPDTIRAATKPTLFHMIMDGVEDELPQDRVRRGGYAIIGGGASSGNTCLAIAYTLGYREIHVYGFDSSHRDDRSHAYDQPMNALIPTMHVEWGGKRFTSSVAMKAQAEKFLITGQRLEQMGCTIHVHGEGLLPAMWHTPATDLSEKHKYTRMWMEPAYRQFSPAESCVDQIAAFLPPQAVVLDLGCGTGRAAVALAEKGHRVTCVDFAENARDKEAASLPFLQWDLSQPIPLRAPYGYCCDVMEHIPPEQVEAVLANIAEACKNVFFRIEFEDDVFGPATLGTPLHLSVHDEYWWLDALGRHFNVVEPKGNGIFIARRA